MSLLIIAGSGGTIPLDEYRETHLKVDRNAYVPWHLTTTQLNEQRWKTDNELPPIAAFVLQPDVRYNDYKRDPEGTPYTENVPGILADPYIGIPLESQRFGVF